MKRSILLGVVPAVMLLMVSSKLLAEDAQPATEMQPAESSVPADDTQKIDCSTASDDIAKLESQKKKTDDKAVGGILGYTPIGLAVNAASDDDDKMTDEQKKQAEDFNKNLDEQIDKIKAACGDPDNPVFGGN